MSFSTVVIWNLRNSPSSIIGILCKFGMTPVLIVNFLHTSVNKRGVKKKQARKGFRPPSAMKEIGYFQNLGIFLEYFWIFWGNFLCRFFREKFLGGFFGRISLEEFFGRN